MMPFTVLRSFIMFLVSWAVLGVGIYFAYDAYRDFQQASDRTTSGETRVVRVPATPETGDAISETAPNDASSADLETIDGNQRTDEQRLIVTTADNSWDRWGKLAVAVLCLGFSLGGRLPLRMFMKSGGNSSAHDIPPTRTVEVNRNEGTRLHCNIYGNEKAPTLILTHGWSLNSSAWNYMLPLLVPHYRVVTWDHAGLGKSHGPDNHDYSLEKLAGDLNAVVQEVAPSGPVILIGHSIGGMTEQTFCRLHHDKLGGIVKGIVLVQTTYTNPVNTNMFAAIVKPLEPLVMLLNAIMIPLSPLVWLSNWQSYFNGSLHWSARFESFTGKQTWEQLDHSAKMGATAWPAVVARGNFGMQKFDEEATLPKINVPVLVVSGSHDRLTIQSASRHIEQLLPLDTSRSHDGGHLGHWEHNEAVSREILVFAKQVLSRTSEQMGASPG